MNKDNNYNRSFYKRPMRPACYEGLCLLMDGYVLESATFVGHCLVTRVIMLPVSTMTRPVACNSTCNDITWNRLYDCVGLEGTAGVGDTNYLTEARSLMDDLPNPLLFLIDFFCLADSINT